MEREDSEDYWYGYDDGKADAARGKTVVTRIPDSNYERGHLDGQAGKYA